MTSSCGFAGNWGEQVPGCVGLLSHAQPAPGVATVPAPAGEDLPSGPRGSGPQDLGGRSVLVSALQGLGPREGELGSFRGVRRSRV